VTFGATVVDHKSELIRDLTPGDFEVLEDGKSQTLRFYAAGDGAAAPVTVYAFGLVPNTGSYRQHLQMTMMQLVEATGGQAFFPSSMKELESAYEWVLAQIERQYYLGYLSANTATDGA